MARAFAIAVEVIILSVIMFSMLWGIRFILFDLWLGPKYRPVVTMALIAVGAVSVVFFIAHLTSFYPSV